MKNRFQTDFIEETIEKTPFSDIFAQKFFVEWCRINDSIVPEFISRELWEEKKLQGILEKRDDGKKTLLLPEDLYLWEMVNVIRTVDHDTHTRKPELKDKKADQIIELGKVFEKAGIYLSEYVPRLKNGKEIAQEMAQSFCAYGRSLQEKTRKTKPVSTDKKLTDAEKQELDEWFLGSQVYQKRINRMGDNPRPEKIEARRIKLLQTYFLALSREGYEGDGESPWEIKKGAIRNLQERTQTQITKAIDTPSIEMDSVIFRRGVEKLMTEMKVTFRFLKELGVDIEESSIEIYKALDVAGLKDELKKVRASGDVEAIGKKELEITEKVQKAVCTFPYKEAAYTPSDIVKTQFINCVGSSILAHGLLAELGIKHLHVDMPYHSSDVLVTTDGRLYWIDFTPPDGYKQNYEISDNDIIIKYKLKTADILAFSRQSEEEILPIMLTYGGRMNLYNSEFGFQYHILVNTGSALTKLGRPEEAVEAYKKAVLLNPHSEAAHINLGYVLDNLGKRKA